MKISVSRYTITNWYFLGVLLVLGISTFLVMPDMDNTAGAGSGLSTISVAALALIQLPLLAYIFLQRQVPGEESKRLIPMFLLLYGIYFGWMTVIYFVYDDTHNIIGRMLQALTILVFPFILSLSYYRARYCKLNVWFYLAVFFILLCITVQYINLYSIANQLDDDGSHIGVSYFPLFILPILLLPESRIVRYLSVVITSLVIISSIKRGGMIALGGSLMVYVFVKQIVSEGNKFRKLLILLAVVLVMVGVLIYIEESGTNNIIERFENLSDDGGSGRDVLWADAFQNIQNRDLGFRFVGNGYRSAQEVSCYKLPAHNDFLEIWYDFGGIGLTFYLLAFGSLCIYTLRLMKRKSRYAPHMAMAMSFYFVISMISIVVLYFWMALLMLSIGIITGLADKELEEKQYALTTAGKIEHKHA